MAKKANNDFIVAIELGSSKITGIAGKKNPDGSITVLAYAREDSYTFIRRGRVYNIDKTAQCLSNIKLKLEKALQAAIGKAYIGIGGQSLHTVRNSVKLPLVPGTVISKENVEELKKTNRECTYVDQELLAVVPQEYKVGNIEQTDPVGVMSDNIEGRYLNVVAHSSLHSNVMKCLALAEIQVAECFIAPMALAECVLSDAEKRSGCALVDLGSETTTVAVYKNNILRHLAVIPLGGNNITKDISAQQIEEEDAEELKLKYGCAYSEVDEHNPIDDKEYMVTEDIKISAKFLNDIVESRVEEIIANVSEQIRLSNCANELLSGVVLTGGASNLRNMELAFQKRTGFEKIKTAKFVLQSINAKNPDITSRDGSLNTILSLLIKGKDNCFGHSLQSADTLFNSEGEPYVDHLAEEARRQEELLRQEEQKRLEQEQREKEEREALLEAQKQRGKSLMGKMKKILSSLLSEEE